MPNLQNMQGGNGDRQPIHDLFATLYGADGMHPGDGRHSGIDGSEINNGLLAIENCMVNHQQRQMETTDFVADDNMFGQSFGEGPNVADVSLENQGSLPKDGKVFEHTFDHHQGVELPSEYNFSAPFDIGIEPSVPMGPASIDHLLEEDFIWYFGA
jgi:hypothetical protein